MLSEQDIKKARKVIESTYDCFCNIVEYKATKNSINKRTEHKEEVVIARQPCRISYKNINNSSQTEKENTVTQITKLFIAPEVQIKPRFKDCSE